MTAHHQRMHGTEPTIDWSWLLVSHTEHQPQVYDQFPGSLGSSHKWNGLRLNFIRQNWGDRIRILEEHPNPLPRCKRCGSQVPAGRLNTCHYASNKLKQGEERRLRHKTLKRCFKARQVSFQINTETLPLSEDFPYLGWTIAYNNIDCATVYQNLRKDWRPWGMVARTQGAMYKAVVQLVLR